VESGDIESALPIPSAVSQKNKSILFIAPEFFNFPELIHQELIRQGYDVYFVPDRPSKRAIVKILVRKARWILSLYLWWHYTSAFANVPSEIDEVFIIKGESFSPGLIRWMRQRFARARFQLYLWDSLKNSSAALSWMKQMDRVWTFDFEDSKRIPSLQFIPNFCIKVAKEEERQAWAAAPIRWNLSFFGTVHTDRLRILDSISNELPKDISFYRFLFFQSPLLFCFRKYFDPFFKKFKSEEMSYRAKVGDDWAQIARSTVAILDIHHPGQTGLTHRTLECLGMGMKLVTTNQSIKNYPFYDERLIHVIDREKPVIDPEFLKSRGEIAPPEAIKDLELEQWLKRMLASPSV
jgi:hypothetical protein